MKKLISLKRVMTAVLATTLALSAASCSKEAADDGAAAAGSEGGEIKVTAVIDTIFGSEMDEKSWAPFVEEFKSRKGIELDFVKPVHNEYYKQLTLMYASDDIPDMVELGSTNYPTYANNGALWDMTGAWDNSELKASGIVDEKYVDALKINDVLYGFPATRGGGTVTYVRQDWLDNLGLSVPTNYEEFNNMLDQFTNGDPDGNGKADTYGITMPGLVTDESPYDIYPREYYQDAVPGIYQKEDGTWVDGMSEPAMVEALQRMKDDYEAGLIDQEVNTNKTSTSREKFYNGQVGTFNYWAGTWSVTLQNNLTAQNENGVVVAIPAISETHYIERPPTAIAITTRAADPERIFNDVILYSHDGGEGQLLFTHGVKDANYTVEGDVYTKLPDPEADKDYEKSWYSPELSISKFDDPFVRPESVEYSLGIFNDSAVITPVPTINDTVDKELPNLLVVRNKAIAAAVIEKGTTVEDAIKQYETEGKDKIDAILSSLNQ